MSFRELLFAFKIVELIRSVYVGYLRLKNGKAGDSVAFSGVRVKIDGVTYEIKGVITRLD